MAQRKTSVNGIKETLTQSVYPWREGNQFELHVNAEAFYPKMINAIAKSKQYVFLEMYLFESGYIAIQFIQQFVQAAHRGVKVCVLLDAFGSMKLNVSDRKKLRQGGVELCIYNPLKFKFGDARRNLFRDHRKVLIIDNAVCFVGGAGISDVFLSQKNGQLGWRDTMLNVKGECVKDWCQVFMHTWIFCNGNDIKLNASESQIIENGTSGRIACSLGIGGQGITRSLVKRIRIASHRVFISSAYFVPTRKVRKELKKAALRGVDVRLLVPGFKSDHPSIRYLSHRFYYRLLKAGVKIYEYQPRFMHQKAILCDEWLSIGSSNIDRWNLRWNLEVNQEIDNWDFSNKLALQFEEDFKESKNIIYEEWINRNWFFKLMTHILERLDLFIDKFVR